VGIRRRKDGATYYQGLRVCGAVHACPVCSAKVSERRRSELSQAITEHQARLGSVALLTLTIPHTIHDKAFALVDSLTAAFRRLWSGRNSLKALSGLVGQVRALEVTHGVHGWHPHLHVLLFFEGVQDFEKLFEQIYRRWVSVTQLEGIGTPSREHGVRLDLGDEAVGDYVSKWGMAEEITKARVKKSRGKNGRTPFALLEDFSRGDVLAGKLFKEYVAAFKGHSQLQWSRGLRTYLGLDSEKSDQDLAQTVQAEDDFLGREFGGRDWSLVLRFRLRGELLEAARMDGWTGIERFFDILRCRSGIYSEST
jgi:hypothetical protein